MTLGRRAVALARGLLAVSAAEPGNYDEFVDGSVKHPPRRPQDARPALGVGF